METTSKYYKGKLNPKFKNWAEAGLALNDRPASYVTDEGRAMFNTIVRNMARTANRRLTLLENNGMTDSPSYLKAGGRGMRYNTDPASLSKRDIVKEFIRLRNFLDNKTSTPAGFKKVNDALSKRLGQDLDRAERAMLWGAYNRLHEMHPSWESVGLTSEEAQRMIVEIKIDNQDDIIQSFEKRLRELQLKRAEEE